MARRLHIRIYSMRLYLRSSEAVDTRNLNLGKHEPCEARMIRLIARTLCRITIRAIARRLAQILYRNCLPSCCIDILQRHPTRNFHREFYAKSTILVFLETLRSETLTDAVGRAILRNKLSAWRTFQRSSCPLRIIVSGRAPTIMLTSRIIMLTMVNLVAHNGTALHAPILVRSNNLTRAILVNKLNLTHETRGSVAQHPMSGNIIKTISKNHTHSIFALVEHSRKVVRQIHYSIFIKRIGNHNAACVQRGALIIVRLVGRKIILAHTLAIDV